SADKNETKASAASSRGKSQKGLYLRVAFRPKADSVLEKWLNDGNELTERDVQSIVRSLRQHRKYCKALEVSEWMQNYKKFEFTAGDYAIQLDLIAKVYGVSRAEKHFSDLPAFAKNESTYCTLLHCYCKERLTEKAEHWMGKIQDLGFDTTLLPYNTLMDLYIANGQMEKVLSMIKHLKKMDVQLDSFTYSLWISACASMSGFDDAEKIVDEIKAIGDDSVSWTIYSALANILDVQNYTSVLSSLVKVGDVEGAEKIFNEWELSSSRYDYRIPNILLAAYSNQMDKAVITMKKALSRVKYSDWKPRSENIRGILKYFEKQGNVECADEFLKLLKTY
ncbi:hypothetical protein KI387_024327, partial [Taxus chinensis]